MNAVAELKHDPAIDIIDVEFTREFLPQFIDWCNAAKVRDDHGNVITLEIREYATGKATLWASVRTPEEGE